MRGSSERVVTCLTCRTRTASWTATLHDARTGGEVESWPVCGVCKAQAERLTVLVTHEPMEAT